MNTKNEGTSTSTGTEMTTIMDPLKVKMAHWQKKMIIPGTCWEICGYSRSAYRTGFYIAAIDMMLDAGPQNFCHPSHILITHTHIDHCAGLPLTMIGANNGGGDDDEYNHKKPHVYAIQEAGPRLLQYVSSMFSLNAMEDCNSEPFYSFHGLVSGTTFPLTIKKTDLEIQVFECDHSIPTIGYGFSEKKQKLKPEYLGLSGKEIASLRKQGVEITCTVTTKKFAYICDTSIGVFDLNEHNHGYGILKKEEEGGYPVVFIECTFLYDDEIENAIQTKHIHWTQLKPIVQQHPDITFILFHFSQRYRDAEIEAFFQREDMANIIWW